MFFPISSEVIKKIALYYCVATTFLFIPTEGEEMFLAYMEFMHFKSWAYIPLQFFSFIFEVNLFGINTG